MGGSTAGECTAVNRAPVNRVTASGTAVNGMADGKGVFGHKSIGVCEWNWEGVYRPACFRLPAAYQSYASFIFKS